MTRRMQMPSVQVREVYEQQFALAPPLASSAASVLVINRIPEPDEEGVTGGYSALAFQVFAPDFSGDAMGASLRVRVNGVDVFAQGTPLAGYGYAEQLTPVTMSFSWSPEFPFESLEQVEVEAFFDEVLLDSWSFTIADTTPPTLVDVVPRTVESLEVVFDEAVSDTALDVARYALARVSTFAVLTAPSEVTRVSPERVLVTYPIPLTFGATYKLTVSGVKDVVGNLIAAPDHERTFSAFNPEVPEGRRFLLWDFVPDENKRADRTRDLYRFITSLQEVTNVLLYEIDRMATIIDPDIAPEAFVDAMLADLGNPFTVALSLAEKRRLIGLLVRIYQLKGTAEGMKSVARLLLDLEIEIVPSNEGGWVLGESLLGTTSILGPERQRQIYTFDVVTERVLVGDERARLLELIEFMRTAHTHLGRILEPGRVDEVIDHVSLGFSRLGTEFVLH